MSHRPGNRVRAQVQIVDKDSPRVRSDFLATEEPLEIRIASGGDRKTVAVTMRTPGSDFELAAGFLFCEGILGRAEDVLSIRYCTDRDVDPEQQYNIVTVELGGVLPELENLERHFFTSSSCGVCGKASLESLEMRGCPVLDGDLTAPAEVLYGLPDKLRAAQGVFEATGGLHAAGIFDTAGNLLCVREDVGRHNAVDKLIGWALLQNRLPLRDCIAMVSGRASFEIMQKCLAAEIPLVCAVSAPSSLAVSVAENFGMTLVGFLREGRFNVYAGRERVELSLSPHPS